MADVNEVTIGVRLDVTLKVGEWDFVKPGTSQSVKFDALPTETEIQNGWKWLWDQVIAQSDELILMLTNKISSLPYKKDEGPARKVTKQGESAPIGGTYE